MATESWLIRKRDNQILGPVTQEELIQSLREGKLESQDEICPANSYWLFLHEKEEVIRYLGQEAASFLDRSSSDNTLTQTETETETDTQTDTQTEAVPEGSTQMVGVQLIDRNEDLEPEQVHIPEAAARVQVVGSPRKSSFFRRFWWVWAVLFLSAAFFLIHWLGGVASA